MSAFMFTDEATHRLVTALRIDRFFFDRERSDLGHDLLSMNAAAINARYNDNYRRNEPYRYKPPAPFGVVQGYKTVRCFLYQCAEGDVPTAWPLYSSVAQVRDFYANLLGHDLEADRWTNGKHAADYREAEWG